MLSKVAGLGSATGTSGIESLNAVIDRHACAWHNDAMSFAWQVVDANPLPRREAHVWSLVSRMCLYLAKRLICVYLSIYLSRY